MSRHQIRLLLCSAASVALIVGALFVLEWFRIDLGSALIAIDLRDARMCSPGGPCTTVELSGMTGFYPVIASATFWSALPLALIVLGQCAARLLTGSASASATKVGYVLGSVTLASAFIAGYLFAPEADTMFDVMGVMVARTFAAPMLLTGTLLGILALRYTMMDDLGEEGEYRPILLDRDDSAATDAARRRAPSAPPTDAARKRAPSAPPTDAAGELARTLSPLGARTKVPSSPPIVARTTSPQQPLLARTRSPSGAGRTRAAHGSEPPIDTGTPTDVPSRARTSSSGPIDLAARLSGAPLSVAIKPPPPEPVSVPPDQIPVAPESGLTIRKRPPSTGPVAADQISMMSPSAVVMRTRPASAAPAPAPIASAPAPIANAPAPEPATLNYAVATATLTRMGISAQREDGTHKQVAWDSVIGVIARRLPTEAPYDGSTFVDVVSAAGATLRFLPWTQIDGAPILGEGEERARAFVQLVAARCLDAKLDSYTKVFADGGGRAAQLPSAKTLAAHDEKLG